MGFSFKGLRDRVEQSLTQPDKEFKQSLDPAVAFRESLKPLIGDKKPIPPQDAVPEFTKTATPAGGLRDLNAERGRARQGGTDSQFNEAIPPYLQDKGYNG